MTLIRALRGRATVVAADIDPYPPPASTWCRPFQRRVLLPRGDDPGFVAALLRAAMAHGADLVVPTVDTELRRASVAQDRFAALDCAVLVESVHTLDLSPRGPGRGVPARGAGAGDRGARHRPRPGRSRPFEIWSVAKPRSGSGGRGFEVVTDPRRLRELPRDGSMLLQELLPGEEYSIDVLADRTGHVVAAVPRARDKVDSGIAVAGRTLRDHALEGFSAGPSPRPSGHAVSSTCRPAVPYGCPRCSR